MTCSDQNPARSDRGLRKDAEENRERILKSAQELFAERGLGVTLDDVAHHAGLGVGTIYRRFPNKEALVEALFERRVIEVIDVARRALELEDGWEGFIYLLRNLLTLETDDRGLRDVILGSEYLKERLVVLKAEVGPLVEALVEKAQQQGSLRPDFRANDVPVLTAMASAAQEYCGVVSPGIWKRYVAVVLDGLRVDRTGLTEMTEDALDVDQLHQAMVNWKSRRSPDPKRSA